MISRSEELGRHGAVARMADESPEDGRLPDEYGRLPRQRASWALEAPYLNLSPKFTVFNEYVLLLIFILLSAADVVCYLLFGRPLDPL